MIEMIRSSWAPHGAKALGIRLVGVWATVGSTATWPEVRVQWEMDDWLAFARAQSGRRPMAFSPDLAAITANDIAGDMILHEDVRSRPGCMRDYHALALSVGALGVPEARALGPASHAARGKRERPT